MQTCLTLCNASERFKIFELFPHCKIQNIENTTSHKNLNITSSGRNDDLNN